MNRTQFDELANAGSRLSPARLMATRFALQSADNK